MTHDNHFRPHELPSTHWSLVREAGHEIGDIQRRALGRVLSQYLHPMAWHVRSKFGVDLHQSEDLVQGFIVHKVLEGELIQSASQAKGRFRTLLLTALDRYAIDQYRIAESREGNGERRPLGEAAEASSSASDPAEIFDLLWARQVLVDAVTRMQEHCLSNARPDLWEVFQGRVLAATLEGGAVVPYAELAARLGWATPAQGSNVLVTANRMFARVLRATVGRYELAPADVEREIDSLHEILSKGGARSGG